MSKPGRCHYCGAIDVPLTRDHIVPRRRGGADRPWNIVSACGPCNTRKGHKMPTCTCSRCLWALVQWYAGVRTPSRTAQSLPQPKPLELPPDLACLSPAMRDLLLRRNAKGNRS